MVMVDEIVMQPVTQAVGILLLACDRGFKFFQDLVGQFIGGGDRGALFAELFHSVEHSFEHVHLVLDHLCGDNATAPADHGKAFVFGTLQDLQ